MIGIQRLRKEYGKAKIRRGLKGIVILMYHRVDVLPDYPRGFPINTGDCFLASADWFEGGH